MKLNLNKLIPVFSFLILINLLTLSSNAADIMVFDSTDKYIGACALTDKSEWTLEEDIEVTTFQVWYNWAQGETELPVKVYKDGKDFAEFTAKRGDCDPYQSQWCNADYEIDKLFPKGSYSTEIPTKKQCLKPGGTGTVRLYSADATNTAETAKEPVEEKSSEPTPALYNETTQVPNQIPETESKPQPPAVVTVEKCGCSITQIALTAAGVSIISSLVVGLLIKRI